MFADIARMQQMNMKSGVELIVDLPEEDTEITADSARLGQVVNNLILLWGVSGSDIDGQEKIW